MTRYASLCVLCSVMVHYVVYIIQVHYVVYIIHYTKCGDMMLRNYTQSRSTDGLLP